MKIIYSFSENDYNHILVTKIEGNDFNILNETTLFDDIKNTKKRIEKIFTLRSTEKICELNFIPFEGLEKDNYGKPYLTNSTAFISISHSFPFIAIQLNTKYNCGIDLEKTRPQLESIKSKYLNTKEIEKATNLEMLCKYWIAKEVLYKLYGKRKLDFIKNLFVEFSNEYIATGLVIKDNEKLSYDIKIKKIEQEYFMAYVVNENIIQF